MPVEKRRLLQYLGDVEIYDMINIGNRMRLAIGVY